MESLVVVKPVKPPSSNMSEIVFKLAKVCRFRSVGVLSNENVPGCESNEDQKIHPQPIEEANNFLNLKEDKLISKLFDTVSSLKLAYIHLQQSHFPYNPDKIQSADELVVTKLKTLVDIKRFYKNLLRPKSHSGPLLLDLVKDCASKREKLQAELENKDVEIQRLEVELQALGLRNGELEEEIKHEEKVHLCIKGTMDSFSEVFEAASKAVHDFAKPLISLMKVSGWNLDLAVNSIEDSVPYSKRSDKKYAFEAYLARRMFYGFDSVCIESQDLEDIGKYYRDPLELLIEESDTNFGKFCKEKYLLVVHSKMEAAFFRNLDHRNLVAKGRHPRTMFYEVFAKMAKWVWLLRLIGEKIDPKAEIFGVRRGTEFSNVYMEDVVGNEGCEVDGRRSVGFMVMPGFRLGSNVVRSRVYVSRLKKGGC